MKKLLLIALLLPLLCKAQSPKKYVLYCDSLGYNHVDVNPLPQVAISGYAKNLIYAGTTSQYVRGDGSLATLPAGYTFTGNTSQLTNGAGGYQAITQGVNQLTKSGNYTFSVSDYAGTKPSTISITEDCTSGAYTVDISTLTSLSGYFIIITKLDASANALTISGPSTDNVMIGQGANKTFEITPTGGYIQH